MTYLNFEDEKTQWCRCEMKVIFIFKINFMSTDLLTGLSAAEAKRQLRVVGPNRFGREGAKNFFRLVVDTIREPMTLLLLLACLLYFLLHEPQQGLLMLAATVFVAAISVYQERKSSRALP